LDFFRGAALFFIFIDHIDSNPISYLTLKSFAFADAAEVFIFISGYTAALVYGRAMANEGFVMATARVLRRAWQLYVAHLCIFMIYTAEVAYTVNRFNNPLFSENAGVGDFLQHPDVAIIRVLLLQFQPTLLDILPLYIALLLAFPLFLVLLRWRLAAGLAVSAGIYVAAQVWHINLPSAMDEEGWYFNPFAWQFLFVLAAAFGLRASEGRRLLPGGRWLLGLAIAVAAGSCLIQLSSVAHELVPRVPMLFGQRLWSLDKSTLAPLRLVSIMALAVLVARVVPRDAAFITSPAGWLLVLAGQNSLEVFCFSILLSVFGSIVLTLVGKGLGVVFAVNLVGICSMLALSLVLAWYRGGGRLPVRPSAGRVA
jgi:hypothetical protein